MINTVNFIEKICGRRPKTINQIKSELKSFLGQKGLVEIALLEEDLDTLIELCGIYLDDESLITDELLSEVAQLNERIHVGRVGKFMRFDTPEQKKFARNIANQIINVHTDLQFVYSKNSIIFIDKVNTVFTMTHIRKFDDDYDGFTCSIILNRITTEQDKQLIPSEYLHNKNWRWTFSNKMLIGSFFSLIEIIYLLIDRKIITHENY